MPRLFGTNGVRGVVGAAMVPELALDLGRALGTWLHRQTHWAVPATPRVVVGTDHRTSAAALQSAVTAGLLSTGCEVLFAGAAPTPAIQYAARQRADASAGVILTASHNPPEFNGIKFCRADGREMTPDLEEEIEAIYFDRDFRDAPWHGYGDVTPLDGVVDDYHKGVLANVDAERIRKREYVVAVDTANGAGCGSLPRLLSDLGCRVVTLNAQPDGTFPGHPSEPVEAYADDVKALVARIDANIGVMVDGDADRAVFIDERGTYVPGDLSLALLAAHRVRKAGGGIVCTPVSSSSCVEEMVGSAGGEVHYTVVGSPKVAAAMTELDAVFGGEENGGLIFPGHQHTRDAAMTVAAMLDLLAETGMPLSALIATVPKKSVVKLKTKVPDGEKAAVIDGVRSALNDGAAPAGGAVRKIDDRDGLKVYLETGWALVRASGTEPIVRVYAEADDAEEAEAIAHGFFDLLAKVRSSLSAPL